MGFKKVDVKTLEMKPFEKIGSEWMLISAAKDGKANTMTASWGGIGVLWGKNVATVYIRPQRHTNRSRRSAGIRRGYTGAGMQKALP